MMHKAKAEELQQLFDRLYAQIAKRSKEERERKLLQGLEPAAVLMLINTTHVAKTLLEVVLGTRKHSFAELKDLQVLYDPDAAKKEWDEQHAGPKEK